MDYTAHLLKVNRKPWKGYTHFSYTKQEKLLSPESDRHSWLCADQKDSPKKAGTGLGTWLSGTAPA